MVDMSNKSLALLLVAAIVISLGGTMLSLNKVNQMSGITGMVTNGTGQVNLSIETNASCTVDNNIYFGSADLGGSDAVISTEVNNAGNWSDCSPGGGSFEGATGCRGLVINNTGNVLLNISFNSSKAGAAFLGTPNADADFTFRVNETESDGGNDGCAWNGTILWAEVPTTASENNICGELNFSDSRDTVVIEFNLSLDANTEPGAKTTDIYVGCLTA